MFCLAVPPSRCGYTAAATAHTAHTAKTDQGRDRDQEGKARGAAEYTPAGRVKCKTQSYEIESEMQRKTSSMVKLLTGRRGYFRRLFETEFWSAKSSALCGNVPSASANTQHASRLTRTHSMTHQGTGVEPVRSQQRARHAVGGRSPLQGSGSRRTVNACQKSGSESSLAKAILVEGLKKALLGEVGPHFVHNAELSIRTLPQ